MHIIVKVYKFVQHNGILSAFRRVLLELSKNKAMKLPSTNKLRVLFIASDNNRTSGAFLSMVALNVILREKYQVDTFVIIPNPGDGDELLIKNKIPYMMIESFDWVLPLEFQHTLECDKEIERRKSRNSKAVSILSRFIKKNHFNIVHINTTYSYVGALAALSAKIPFIWHIREFLEEDQGNTLWDRQQGNRLINQSSKVVAISKSIYKKYQKVIDASRLVCIPNGIDDKKFYFANKTILKTDCVKFIFVGGFEYYKGQIEFAKACTLLYKKGYDFEVHFIGTGRKEIQDKVRNIFDEEGMSNKIFYHGYKNNVADYLKMTDISFTCSKSEAFGRTTVEAMLAGNLVIGANTAGTQELINDGVTGLLYEQGNAQNLYEKMVWTLQNRLKAQKIAQAGREYMYQNMTSEINADKIFALYQEIL